MPPQRPTVLPTTSNIANSRQVASANTGKVKPLLPNRPKLPVNGYSEHHKAVSNSISNSISGSSNSGSSGRATPPIATTPPTTTTTTTIPLRTASPPHREKASNAVAGGVAGSRHLQHATSSPDVLPKTYISISAYESQTEQCLSFSVGDKCVLIQQSKDGWWLVNIGGREGWTPGEYWEEDIVSWNFEDCS